MSIPVIAISAGSSTTTTTKSAVGPSATYPETRTTAVTTSTIGYRQAIVIPHERHRPRSRRNDSTGMLSYHFSSALQPGQAEPGRNTGDHDVEKASDGESEESDGDDHPGRPRVRDGWQRQHNHQVWRNAGPI